MNTIQHGPTLPPAEIDAAVRAERRRLCDYLDGLDTADWDVPSLCAAWTVREVVAHLTTTTRETVFSVMRSAIKARGSFDRMQDDVARGLAARYPPAELVARLRESAESTRRMPGSGPMDPLMDVLVHGQDIARPLGRPYPMPTRLALPALAYVAKNRLLGGPKRVAGLELVTTDADWSTGQGPAVRGRAEELLLAAAGRLAGLAGLTGPGLDRLAERLGDRR
ncbi:maleylpyruvate isomerase family mycothiol-dependent enzyme [Cryptosporangium aurantiacum]|uniref:TIGR03083 family protein n=1 Tax=Cryptosporangium aurantiacum TaxID=134849 RepID=A0A1M7TXX1_9ACTN|nr:maleylpyruvate isomerase family mycothiol-dependent enzyme [Cryptosporangium aurantiacum]SHN75525.1 TIGR03083 family protein [Cryptosporangium aurantiacum]